MTDSSSAPGQGRQPAEIDTAVPQAARIWNYWLGGKDNYPVDRAVGDQFREVFPGIVDVARSSRQFLIRVVRYLAGDAGIRQFLDIGAGLPTADNTHEVAQRVAPESRIVYVDNDPVVLAHARALLTSTPQGATDYIDADVREPDRIVTAAARTLDFTQPIALLLTRTLGHIGDYDAARSIVRRLLEPLPLGSYLALNDGTNVISEASDEAQRLYNQSGAVPYHLRSPEQIAGFFEGLELVEPGVVSCSSWRPDPDAGGGLPPEVDLFGGVGRKYGAVTYYPAEHIHAQHRAPEQARRQRVISTGFASRHDAADTVSPQDTLKPGQPYLYWFEIGDQSPRHGVHAPHHRDVPLERVSVGTPLTVALFAFPGELEISTEADIGEFVITADGSAQVTRQPLREPPELPDGARLLFPIRTPVLPGRYRLRCNLYCRQTLLQSRLVEVQVTNSPHDGMQQAQRSTVDYTVNATLDPELLAAIQPLRLSMFLNDNGDGTHGFRFLGEQHLKGDAVIDGQTLQDLLDRARETYRRSAWDSDDEWNAEWKLDRYVYRNPPGPERLAEDLIRMARAGYRLWSSLAVPLSAAVHTQLPPKRSPQRSLQEIMRRPGFVEVTCRYSARMVIPASILYDYPLDPNKDPRVCQDALDAIASQVDLTTHHCFTGGCAYYDDDTVVCPGGFWGYRHGIGLPQSRAEQADEEMGTNAVDSRPVIRCTEKPEFVIGVADDFNGDHVRRVRALGDARSRITNVRDTLLADLRAEDFAAHVVYFFCHGALINGISALLVGPRGSVGITQENIQDGSMYWEETNPLVVLNGCSTAAVEPKYALNLVDAFVRGAFASGVIGTEITVFESLATLFAEEFFTYFLDYDEPISEAVRRARLQVLATGNPLGLVYIVYAAPRLQLVP